MKRRNWFRFVLITTVVLVAISLCGAANAEESMLVAVNLNGKPLAFSDQGACLIDGRTYIPIRGVSESLGAKVKWDDATQTATITKNQDVIKLPVGTRTAMVNGKGIFLDAPVVVQKSRMLVPLRFVSESLGLKVDWDNVTQTVKLSTSDYQIAMAVKKAKANATAGTTGSEPAAVVLAASTAPANGYLSPDAPDEFKAIYEMYPSSNCGKTRLYYSNNGSPESGSPIDIYLAKNSSGSQAIVLVSLSEDTLNAAKEMLKVYYPTSYEEVYASLIKAKDSGQKITGSCDGKTYECFTAQYLEVRIRF